MSERIGVEVIAVDSAQRAFEHADIVLAGDELA
jgi:hypothetical protein